MSSAHHPADVDIDDGDDDNTDEKKTSTFLLKTFAMVSDTSNSAIVAWNDAGDEFVVKNEHAFASSLLPTHFRHKNFSSFVRQLNFYGFRKRTTPNQTSHFKHPCFRRGRKDLLSSIKRKVSEPAAQAAQSVKDTLSSLQSQVNSLQQQYSEIWALQNNILYMLTRAMSRDTSDARLPAQTFNFNAAGLGGGIGGSGFPQIGHLPDSSAMGGGIPMPGQGVPSYTVPGSYYPSGVPSGPVAPGALVAVGGAPVHLPSNAPGGYLTHSSFVPVRSGAASDLGKYTGLDGPDGAGGTIPNSGANSSAMGGPLGAAFGNHGQSTLGAPPSRHGVTISALEDEEDDNSAATGATLKRPRTSSASDPVQLSLPMPTSVPLSGGPMGFNATGSGVSTDPATGPTMYSPNGTALEGGSAPPSASFPLSYGTGPAATAPVSIPLSWMPPMQQTPQSLGSEGGSRAPAGSARAVPGQIQHLQAVIGSFPKPTMLAPSSIPAGALPGLSAALGAAAAAAGVSSWTQPPQMQQPLASSQPPAMGPAPPASAQAGSSTSATSSPASSRAQSPSLPPLSVPPNANMSTISGGAPSPLQQHLNRLSQLSQISQAHMRNRYQQPITVPNAFGVFPGAPQQQIGYAGGDVTRSPIASSISRAYLEEVALSRTPSPSGSRSSTPASMQPVTTMAPPSAVSIQPPAALGSTGGMLTASDFALPQMGLTFTNSAMSTRSEAMGGPLPDLQAPAGGFTSLGSHAPPTSSARVPAAAQGQLASPFLPSTSLMGGAMPPALPTAGGDGAPHSQIHSQTPAPSTMFLSAPALGSSDLPVAPIASLADAPTPLSAPTVPPPAPAEEPAELDDTASVASAAESTTTRRSSKRAVPMQAAVAAGGGSSRRRSSRNT